MTAEKAHMPTPPLSDEDIEFLYSGCKWRDALADEVPPVDQMQEIDTTRVDDELGKIIARMFWHSTRGYFVISERAENGRVVCSSVVEPRARPPR